MPEASWLSGASGDWMSATLWDSGTVPNGFGVDVVVDAPEIAGSYTVTIDAGAYYAINSLTLNTGLPGSGIADAGTLQVGGSIDVTGGTISVAGALSGASVAIEDGLALAGGVLNAAQLTIGQSGALVGTGTVMVAGSMIDAGFIGLSGGSLLLVATALTLDGGQIDAGSGTLTVAGSFANLAAGTLDGGNYEADGGGVLLLPSGAGISVLQQADLFLLADGTLAATGGAYGGALDIAATLQTIDALSAIQVVGGSFTAQYSLFLGGRIDVIDGLLSAPSLSVDTTGLLYGVGTVAAAGGIVNNGAILSGTGLASSIGDAIGDLVIMGPVAGSGELIADVGTLELAAGSAEPVILVGGATLRVDAPIAADGTLYAGTITESGDSQATPGTVDLPNLAVAGLTMAYAGTPNGGVVTLGGGADTAAELDFAGTYDPGDFSLADDGTGGTDVVTACYVEGTRILTPLGEVAIEQLRVGDPVLGADGCVLPVVWLGHRRVRCDRHPDPALVWPVRVQAGAFGDATPARALWLSPDHAVFSDGALVPVRHLLNDASITQVPMDAVRYWHVELSRHAVILAEGLPAESYLDTGNRDNFANGPAHLALHPEFAPRTWGDACGPLVTQGGLVDALNGRLRARLARLGWTDLIEGGPALHTGRAMRRPARSDGRRHCFLVPPATGRVRLIVAAEARIEGILLDGRLLQHGDAAVVSGLTPEAGRRGCWRCRGGTAELALPPGCRVLELVAAVTLAGRGRRAGGAARMGSWSP